MLLGAVALVHCSCNKFLEEYNPAGATEEVIYDTPEGFETGVNGCYTYTRVLWGKEEGHLLLEAGTDLWAGGGDNSKQELTNYSNLGSTESYITTRLWTNSYAAINLCNTMLGYLQYAKPEVRDLREAELRFLRSYHWWVLAESFGDIHFSLTPNHLEGTTVAKRTSVDQVYEQIEKDLDFAYNTLPNTSADPVHVTKPIVEAFWARVALTRGKNADAARMAKNVIASYDYELEDVATLWDVTKESSNKESIWSVAHHGSTNMNGAGTYLHQGYLMKYQNISGMKIDEANGNPTSRLMPTYHLLSLFDQGSDARFAASFQSVWMCNDTTAAKWTLEQATEYGNPALVGTKRYNPGDTAAVLVFGTLTAARKFPKVAYNAYDVTNLYNADFSPKDKQVHFSLKKHMDPTRGSASETNTAKDFVMIRLAEMYLIVVEADFKINGPTGADAVSYLNQLRAKRALPTAAPAFTAVASIPDIDFILDERARELCGEQLRWLDLKRTGKLLERVRAHNHDAAANIKDYHVLRPIPQDQIGRIDNPADFPQNPGY
jgi:hypothetical protein